jgi:hypothetical protein
MIRIEVEISASVIQTIDTYSKVIWQHQLNGNGFFEVLVTGSDEDYTSYFQRGRVINFYKNNVLDLKGSIEKITFTSEGLMRIQGIELGAKRYANANTTIKSYMASNTNAVITDLQARTSGVSQGTINSSSFDSFRTHSNQSCLQVLSKLATLQGKDWYFDYSGSTVYVNLVDNKGVSKVAVLNGGIDVDVVTKEEDDTKKVKKVTVIGASYGNNQITNSAVSGFVQGDPEITIVDKSILTTAEALTRATDELSVLSATSYNYFFKVVDFNRSFSTGDTIDLIDRRTNTDAELRIVSVKRVATQDAEKLELEVRSTSDRERTLDRLKQESMVRSFSENSVVMNQKVDDASLTAALSLSIAGNVVANNAVLNKSGAVGVGFNATGLGYQAFGLSADCLQGLSHGLTPVTNSNNDFFYHAAFVSFRVNITNTTTVGFHSQPLYIWLRNDNTGEYWPNSTGMLISDGFGLKLSDSHYHITNIPGQSDTTTSDGIHNHGGYLGIPNDGSHNHAWSFAGPTAVNSSAPFNSTESFTLWIHGYIHAPLSWKNQSYRLWYRFDNPGSATWYWDTGVYKPRVYYGYHGVQGHAHSDTITYTDSGHAHSWSGSGSGTATIPDHTHGVLT